MWKKSFQNEGKLLKHIDGKKIKETLFIEEEETDYDLNWNPLDVDISEWTSDKIELFLASAPASPPVLTEIKTKEKNPYGGNPYMLCIFEHDNKKIELWISSTLIFHTPTYRTIYDEFKSNN